MHQNSGVNLDGSYFAIDIQQKAGVVILLWVENPQLIQDDFCFGDNLVDRRMEVAISHLPLLGEIGLLLLQNRITQASSYFLLIELELDGFIIIY